MKRSEMIERLKTRLNQIKGNDPDTGEELYPNDDYLVWALLDEVEEVGMLPPAYTDKSIWDRAENSYAEFNEWEPEDETK
jgi:hypothetical protein